MITRATPRGQPLLVLGLLLGGWIVLRAALWDASPSPAYTLDEIHRIGPRIAVPGSGQLPARPVDMRLVASAPGWSMRVPPISLVTAGPSVRSSPALVRALPAPDGDVPFLLPFVASGSGTEAGPAEGSQPLILASAPFQPPQNASVQPVKRWSGDAWLLIRGNGTGNLAAGRGSYGASQAGAVLRFAVLPDSAHRPAIYLRGSKAISGAKEAEGALGVSARPIPTLPLRAAAELRISRTNDKAELRPAAYVVTELPPFDLPLAFRGEAYAQGGYVGGSYPSAFVDGQLRIDRPVVSLGGVEIRVGGGVWGGAQRGAERLDVGPGATVAFDTGPANARVSLDWRQRIAGDARPASGPSLTVSVGF